MLCYGVSSFRLRLSGMPTLEKQSSSFLSTQVSNQRFLNRSHFVLLMYPSEDSLHTVVTQFHQSKKNHRPLKSCYTGICLIDESSFMCTVKVGSIQCILVCSALMCDRKYQICFVVMVPSQGVCDSLEECVSCSSRPLSDNLGVK